MTSKKVDSNDHYVSRTYLKCFSFTTPSDQARVAIYRKKGSTPKKLVTVNSICFEKGGDICNYLENKFALREMLFKIERVWNIFIEAVKSKSISEAEENEPLVEGLSMRLRVSMFISYLRCASPSLKSMMKKQLGHILHNEALSSLSEEHPILIQSTGAELSLEEDFIKSISIQSIGKLAVQLYHRNWEILENKTDIVKKRCQA